MKCFAKSVLDAVSSGPKGHFSQFAATEFDSTATQLSWLTHDVNRVKTDIDRKYGANGATNITKGIVAGHNALRLAKPDLAKVMVIISDGEGQDNRWFRIQAA